MQKVNCRGTALATSLAIGMVVVGLSCKGESATGPAPTTISQSSADPQLAMVSTAVSQPPSVKVVDASGYAVGGVAVTFAVASGGGSVTGPAQSTAMSGVLAAATDCAESAAKIAHSA